MRSTGATLEHAAVVTTGVCLTGDRTITAIDSHAHVFRRDLPLALVRRHTPDYDALLSDYLALLDAHLVSHAVLVQPSFLGTDNHFMLDALRARPQRLRGVVVVEPTVSEGELQTLADGGICGIRLNLVGLKIPDFSQSDWRALFARVRALGWHVELHCGSSELAHAAQPVLDAGCKLVIDHFGRPDPTRRAAAPTRDGTGCCAQRAAGLCGSNWRRAIATGQTSAA